MDIYCEWNSDFVLTPNGDIQAATGWDECRQRIVRSLITNSAQILPDGTTTAPDYVFHPSYGLGCGRLVGQNPTEQYRADLLARVNAAVLADVSVDKGAVPQVRFSQLQPGEWIIYVAVKLANGQPGRVAVKIS
jgi:hypothetical protein